MRIALACLALLGLAAPAAAQEATASARGACSKMVLGGEDATDTCGAKITSMTLPDGTVFLIFASGRTMIGFSGSASEVRTQGRDVSWPVRFVNIGAPGAEPNAIPASGSCRSGDLARGSVTTVCSARTAQGAFETSFASSPARR